ncbi:MAG: class I SAM-dependent methyltransferase [Porticoccaceae bacterium]|nr:class I SAM-dependent methyltransferase [Porticoccaceae bacterium]
MSKNRQILANLYQKYLEISPVGSAMALDNWKGKKFGQYLLDSERKLLVESCADLAGYRVMHMGLIGERCVLESFNQLHQFYVRPSSSELNFDGSSVVAAYEDLPLPSEVVDVAVVQHALEYSASPQAVLAETARVLAPGGHMIFYVFNPLGPMGLIKWPMRLATKRPEYDFFSLRKGRVYDWLSLLNCEVIGVQNGAYNLPIGGAICFRDNTAWQKMCEKVGSPWGNFYMIHAVKRVAGGISNRTRAWSPLAAKPYGSKRTNINRTPHN